MALKNIEIIELKASLDYLHSKELFAWQDVSENLLQINPVFDQISAIQQEALTRHKAVKEGCDIAGNAIWKRENHKFVFESKEDEEAYNLWAEDFWNVQTREIPDLIKIDLKQEKAMLSGIRLAGLKPIKA